MSDPLLTEAPAQIMARRFRGFLPVVIDVETGGFNSTQDALLEIAAVIIEIDATGIVKRGLTIANHVKPFAGANIEAASLAVNGIDPHHPLRPAVHERDALGRMFTEVRQAIRRQGCKRAILVGHNAAFDLGFLNAAVLRAEIRRNPFHPFSCFDTATLAGAALGQTVLAKAVRVAGLEWDNALAHSAIYDAERTADLFCMICNGCLPSFLIADALSRELGWNESADVPSAVAGLPDSGAP